MAEQTNGTRISIDEHTNFLELSRINAKIPVESLLRFKDRWNWTLISTYQHFSLFELGYLENFVNFRMLFKPQPFDRAIADRYKEFLDWDFISGNCALDVSDYYAFRDYINWDYMLPNTIVFQQANLDTISSFKTQSPLKQQWCRSQTDKKIAGVLGGLAVYYGIGSTPLRIGYLLFCLLLVATRSVGMLFPILLYLVLWYLLKKEKGDEEKEEKRDLVKEKEVKPHKKSFFWSFFGILFKVIGYFIATIFFVCLFLILVTGLLSIFGVGVAGGITSVFLLDYLPFVLSPIEQVLFYVIWGMVFVLFFSVLVLFCYKIL